MRTKKNTMIAVICFIFALFVFLPTYSIAKTYKLRISSGVGNKHCWVAGHMVPFTERVEKATNGQVKFSRYFAGELHKAGKGLESLKGGSIDVADPFLAPYHAGVFPLTDVVQLPVLNTDSINITEAFIKLFNSKEIIENGKTFYDLEIESQGLVAWPVGPTDAYVISTTGKRFNDTSDIKGTPIRGGARTQLIFLKKLGATEVYMTGMDAYEAFSRGTIQGIVYSIPDWKAYGFTELIKYTIVGVSLGHYPSYMAMTKDKWERFPDDIKTKWKRIAFDMARESAKYWMSLREPTVKESMEVYKAEFENVKKLNTTVQKVINNAAIETWKTWIAEEEKKGNPAKKVAKLWAKYVLEVGGALPDGVEELINE
ncbi:hypothetical protein DSCW_05090 [Desulfosarcina widdelii]|uniref:C4-dicarboxylate ABC transporter substrate-binding protein n=1 Tax=Desulfosarcina widdelii TaxID=947919 RepID=A0A5K7YTC7_9BACT|nr:C4-dicarboxylate ABC transporter substrate-binding protein [Desulfosarcina widdelii]BBO73092.1 hypothetical protein DSCW_05090 [Desulfosarcina widdelii]